MKRYLISSLLVVTALVASSWSAISLSSPRPHSTETDPDLVKFAKYKSWTLVNPTPQLMEPLSAALCARLPGPDEGSPHLNKYLSVFVNDVGRKAMMSERSPKFPPGSMIVKEKLSAADSTKPELLTAMLKREKGYNPEGGDWEYLLLDGSASKIDERGKLGRCSGCHSPYANTDFVTRTYLPQQLILKLR